MEIDKELKEALKRQADNFIKKIPEGVDFINIISVKGEFIIRFKSSSSSDKVNKQ